jgi:hypothetical protein
LDERRAYQLTIYTPCSRCLPPCDTVSVVKSIAFYPGDTIEVGGVAYTQPDTVVQSLLTPEGCDSIVTCILYQVLTELQIDCPANVTATISSDASTVPVDYPLPAASTDCPDPDMAFALLQGPPPGDLFPPGPTQVCYEVANGCGIRDTCCFTVSVIPAPSGSACDENELGCLHYELLDIRFDAAGRRRYRIRMTNQCASALRFAYIGLPPGVSAFSPPDGSAYTAPGGRSYEVRNPNASPFYSIRYKPLAGSLNAGASDVFEYTLPPHSEPAYIHVAAKLNDGSTSEAYLNTFYCPVQPYSTATDKTSDRETTIGKDWVLALHPNPSSGRLWADLSRWKGQSVHIQVFNAQGKLVFQMKTTDAGEQYALDLPENLAAGLYYLHLQAGGENMAVKFALQPR